ncbi:MAG TPA: hypothetical protein VFJ85_08105 [Acidimicrobiales bacterium]|nr:hypothetical protein [Acidimicrobiales bacterium]
MQREVPAGERERYLEWLRSPSVGRPDSPETVIAWNLAAGIGLHPTRVLRSLRRERGYLAGEMEAVTAAVHADPDLVFLKERDGYRRAAFRQDAGWRAALRRDRR